MRRRKQSPEPSARGNFTPPRRGAAPAQGSAPQPAAAHTSSSSHLFPRNWRVPTRLNAIVLIPVVVGLVVSGFHIKGSIETWQEARDAEKVTKIVAAAEEYTTALLNERDLSAQPLLGGDRDNEAVQQARQLTDEKSAAFHQEVAGMPSGLGLERRLQLVENVEPKLEEIRQTAYTRSMDPVKTEESYLQIGRHLLEFSNELRLGTGNATAYGGTVHAIALAKSAQSLQRSIGMHLLVKPSADAAILKQQVTAFTSYAYLEKIAVQEYISGGSAQDVTRLKQVMEEKTEEGRKRLAEAAQQARAEGRTAVTPPSMNTMIKAMGSGQTPDQLRQRGITPETWMAASTLKFDGYRQVETELVDRAMDDAGQIVSDAQRDAGITGAVVILALLAAAVVASFLARQMSRSIRQLRNTAFGVAEQRLPMLVDQLSRTDPDRVDTRVAPIPVTTTDEIGEVARAFDQVHREAVRLAAEQALLRGNINAIFTRLSRRNQSLLEGQLTLITDLENNEADPDQLENLVKLEQLAARIRRNGENLLVLADEEPGRRWDQPVPLADVVRAASSEVEQCERIELSGVPQAEIHGRVATDLVHLLAELLENATTFSSPQTMVRVTGARLRDGRIMIEIHDKGIGLTAEDFADINHKLADPPTVDAAISQHMGLFVVGRLADRHGIRVQLRPSGEEAGTTSLVMLPDVITHGGGGGPRPQQDEFTVSQIIPEQQPSPSSGPMRTAAELGFDDSRYGDVPNDTRRLGPVGRPLVREEGRAAPDTQTHGQPQRKAVEAPRYGDDGQARQPGYGNSLTPYQDRQSGHGRQRAYEEPQQASYDQTYVSPSADGTSNTGYPEPTYAEPFHDERTTTPGAALELFSSSAELPDQDGWPQHNGHQDAYRSQYVPKAESAQAADVRESDRVGFEHPGPAPSTVHELTDAGLPRRGSSANGAGAQQRVTRKPSTAKEPGGDWRSANNQRWQQAAQLRKPKAGGVTSSGLPRRVPTANLVEGAAGSIPQGDPQVSRTPEDIRGRLSNLRHGVHRGRNTGSETNGQGFGPDSTYDQER